MIGADMYDPQSNKKLFTRGQEFLSFRLLFFLLLKINIKYRNQMIEYVDKTVEKHSGKSRKCWKTAFCTFPRIVFHYLISLGA